MARPKTPNSILKSKGSKKVRDEIEPEIGTIEPTYDLSPEGKKAWDRICVEMDKLGILSPAYADFVTIAAGAVGDIEIASRDLIERGHISITERGETKNPSFTIKTSAQTIAHKYLSALGLTPTTIGKLVKPNGDDGNEFADL
jgi:P27 family predicted phage terminase small subunit